MLSLTQIELRKVISQELADAGINRNTLVDMVHKAVADKVQKKVDELFNSSKDGIENKIQNIVSRTICYDSNLRRTLCDIVKQNIVDIDVTIKTKEERWG